MKNKGRTVPSWPLLNTAPESILNRRQIDLSSEFMRIVVVCDLYSSERLLQFLDRAGKIKELARFIDLAYELQTEFKTAFGSRPAVPFEVYKFTGDGWIFFFPQETLPNELLMVIHTMARRFWQHFVTKIRRQIYHAPRIGIRFGIDFGMIHGFPTLKGREFIGTPIIKAKRLQDALKQERFARAKIMMSSDCFHSLRERTPNAFDRWRPKILEQIPEKHKPPKSHSCVEILLDVRDWVGLPRTERRNANAWRKLSTNRSSN